MSYMSDILTLGLVLTLLFGSICLYLYTRIQQIEQKLELTETILLELKMASEFNNKEPVQLSKQDDMVYVDMSDNDLNETHLDLSSQLNPYVEDGDIIEPKENNTEPEKKEEPSVAVTVDSNEHAVVEDITELENFSESSMNVNYEAMTLKELKFLAEKKGITKISTLRRPQLLEAIRDFDQKSLSL